MKKIVVLCFSLFQIGFIHAQYNVEIVRDSFGVPHIFGKTDADVAYGLGYAECEDDFKTVQWGLLASKHMLGRHLGIEGAKIDFAVQLLRVRKAIDERYETQVSAEFKKVLEGGAAGVNKYAKEHPEEVLVKKGFPVTAKDILGGYMLGQALMTGVDGALNSIVNGSLPILDFKQFGHGSNALAMNSKITADGEVYLDINSHQPLEGPLSWYEAHLCSEEGWNILGSTFHGGITIFHGVNENLGWAHTVNSFDAIDIFQLQPDPNKKNHYLVDGVSYPLETGHAKLAVNLAKHKDKHKFILTVGKKIWWSMYGATMVTKKGIFAIRLGSNMDAVKSAEQWYRMDKAKNFTEWRKALDMQGIANFNFIYGDKRDTIYIVSNGLVPKRSAGFNWQTTLPGNTSKTLWQGFLPVDSLPHTLNPKCGYVFNTNQTAFQQTSMEENPDPKMMDITQGQGMDEDNRSRRFYENIVKFKKVSWDDFLKIKYDSKYPKSFKFFRNYGIDDLLSLKPTDYSDVGDMIQTINQWDKTTPVTDTNAAACIKSLYMLYNTTNDSMERLFHKDSVAKTMYFVKCLRDTKADMQKNFGSIHPPLGDYQRHQRGDVDLPTDGGPDQWNAKYTNAYKNGRARVWMGESYILLARFTKTGTVLRSISPYGTSNKPGSKHYTDQMQMYVHHETKPMTLDKNEIYSHAERIYRP